MTPSVRSYFQQSYVKPPLPPCLENLTAQSAALSGSSAQTAQAATHHARRTWKRQSIISGELQFTDLVQIINDDNVPVEERYEASASDSLFNVKTHRCPCNAMEKNFQG